jgi:hypothetical protein
MPKGRMGPPLRSFAADAHDCIMVRVLGPTGYKVVARVIAPASGLPSDRHPDRTNRAVVLEAVKVLPSNGGACRKGRCDGPTLTASTRASASEVRVGTKKRALRSNEETDEGQQIRGLCELLDKKSPIQGNRGRGTWVARRGLWGFECRG